jgi:hypothetical protein
MATGNVACLGDRHVEQPQNVAQEVRLKYKPCWELLAGEARGDENTDEQQLGAWWRRDHAAWSLAAASHYDTACWETRLC